MTCDTGPADDGPTCPDCGALLVCVVEHVPDRPPVQRFDPPSRGRVSDDLMRYLFNEGLNGREIVDALREDYGITYTRQAVSRWRSVHNMPPLRTKSEAARALVPWRVLIGDSDHRLLKALRTEARMRDNLPISQPDRDRHAAVKRGQWDKGMVVKYDQNGFSAVPRRPGIDLDYIHDPTTEG